MNEFINIQYYRLSFNRVSSSISLALAYLIIVVYCTLVHVSIVVLSMILFQI